MCVCGCVRARVCVFKYKPLRINILDSFNSAMDKNTIEFVHTPKAKEKERTIGGQLSTIRNPL